MNITLKSFPSIVSLAVIVALLGNSSLALAIEDQFTISQQVVSADTTAPSIPQNVTATGVAVDQINVAWSASTDAVGVTGYQLFRGGTQIATTTSLTYSDTGLTESTTYAYNVTAFDAAGNISARSATTSGTTASPSTTPAPVTRGGNAGKTLPRLVSLSIEAETASALISWESSAPTRSILDWGVTQEYGMGSLAERTYATLHSTRIAGLMPDTEYKFKITALSQAGDEVVLAERAFRTLPLADTFPPENVSALSGVVEGNDGVLTWQNPEADFDRVRIIRKDGGYPSDPNDGTLIYEGGAERFEDTGAFSGFDQRYYAVFTYDRAGNESSGAVVRVARPGTPEPKETLAPVQYPFTFQDLIFIQEGKQVSYIGTDVPLKAELPFEVLIDYDRLPEHLKTIMITLKDASNIERTFSFLLRVNEDKTAYRAHIAPLSVEGGYPLALSIFDYKERTISKAAGTLHIAAVAGDALSEDQSLFGGMIHLLSRISLFWLLLLLLLLIALLAYNESRRRKNNAQELQPRTQ